MAAAALMMVSLQDALQEAEASQSQAEPAEPTEAPPDEPPQSQTEPPAELRDEDSGFTNGIPSKVYDNIEWGIYAGEKQAAIATAAAMRADYEDVRSSLAESRRELATANRIADANQKELDLAWVKITKLQDGHPAAPSSGTMPSEPGFYWVDDQAIGIAAPDFGPWNALLFISRDEDGDGKSVKLYRILRHSVQAMDYPWETATLVFGPRLDPPKLVLPESESETP